MTKPEPVSELDLLAYADGLLDKDPQRRARVEHYLAGAPEAAARAKAYRAQTQALQVAYGARAHEPVPDRLHDVFRPRVAQGRKRVTGLRAAAMIALTAAGGVTGWYLGQEGGPARQVAEQRLPSVLREAARDHSKRWQKLPMSVGDLDHGGALRWEANGVSLNLPIPDLSPMGYALKERRNFAKAETQVVALSYAGANGANLRLLIAPMTAGEPRRVVVTKAGGEQLAYWSQGPLAVAIQTDAKARDITALGRKIRDAIARQAPPRDLQLRELPPSRLEVKADAASSQSPERAEQPATHTIIGTDTVIE